MYCAQIYIAKGAKLDEQWCLDCVHDVFFAAKGLSVEERTNDRMRRLPGPSWMAAPDKRAGDAALPRGRESKSGSPKRFSGSGVPALPAEG
jgi:hypothetical protein